MPDLIRHPERHGSRLEPWILTFVRMTMIGLIRHPEHRSIALWIVNLPLI
ncbi:MAG: hypothetical protein H2050_02615 [Sphingobium sp.]|jgi:hypothetical protein|nr:hypothetical protein [Sphingobium sp.]MBA4753710.1 hypothetical protein [Sphingobium sp.]MBU0868636.1 hypothetical protein [Alphaproteobacteria bacterium]MBU1796517.1 hypothetical protein [Alphaproteobacteria bacterium]